MNNKNRVEPSDVSEEEVNDTQGSQEQQSQDQLEECQNLVNDWKEKCMRVSADFENFKRRAVRERAMWTHSGQADLLTRLLPIVDDFDRAFAEQEEQEEESAWLAGFAMIRKSYNKILQEAGVEEIAQVTTFDPELHEAIMQVDAEEHESGDVVQVLQKGFMFKDSVLRPAKVSVAK